MYLVYNGFLLLPRLAAAPVGAWLVRRGTASPAEWSERLGGEPGPPGSGAPSRLWLQASSVGEAAVAFRILETLETLRAGLTATVTTTTRTGQDLARRLAAGTRVMTAFFPFDFPSAVGRTLDRLDPEVFVMVETEIWPNLLRACRARGIRTLIVNGRVSPRAWRRYRLVRPLMRRAFASVDLACVQDPHDADRFADLGLSRDRIRVTGNVKYDMPPPPAPVQVDTFRRELGLATGNALVVAGSTAEGEGELVLDAFEGLRRSLPDVRLLLAPRHPERFASARETAGRRGHSVATRSAGAAGGGAADVIVLDTIGELRLAYAAARAAFVGGSLVPTGGQNVLEPASCGLAPVFGPHMDNFREPANRLLAADAATQVTGSTELTGALEMILSDPERARRSGERAREAVLSGAGATRRCADAIVEALRSRATDGKNRT